MKHKFIKWVIEINPSDVEITSAITVLNTRSNEFESFVVGMITMLEAKGYLLNEDGCYDSDVPGSISKYYEFIKFTDNLETTLAVEIRVSDHTLQDKIIDGKKISGKRRRSTYLDTTRMPEIAKEFDSPRIPVSVPVDIVFNDQHMLSYFEALKYINRLVNDVLK